MAFLLLPHKLASLLVLSAQSLGEQPHTFQRLPDPADKLLLLGQRLQTATTVHCDPLQQSLGMHKLRADGVQLLCLV